MAFDLGSVIAKIEADITGFKKGMDQAEKQVSLFGDKINKTADLAGKALLGIGVAGAAATGVLLKKGIEAASQFEQQEIAFTTLLKDREKAVAAIKAIEEDAKQTPYNLPDLIKANQLLVSAGVSTEDARDQIKALGNAIAATGGGTAELNRLGVNLQQIKAVGKASALDIKQFAFAGINIYQLLADATGKNVDEVKEMEISYELLTEALAKASQEGGMFEGAMANQANSLQGLKSNLEDVVDITLKDIVMQSGLFDAMKSVTGAAVEFVTIAGPQIIEAIKGVIDVVQRATNFYNEHSRVINGIVAFIGAFFVPALIAVTVQMGINMVTAIANTTLNIIKFGIEGWKAIAMLTMKAIRLGLATAAFILHTTVTIAQTVAQIALTAATWLFNAALAVLTSPIFLVVAAIVALIAIGYLLIKNWDQVKAFGKAMLDFLVEKFNGFVGKLRDVGHKILDAIMWPFNEAKKRVEEAVNFIKDKLDFTQRHSPSVVDIVTRGVREVNKAMQGLEFNTNLTPNAAALAVSNSASNSPTITQVRLDMSGAIITDAAGAMEMGELLGDSIIKKLQQNVRF